MSRLDQIPFGQSNPLFFRLLLTLFAFSLSAIIFILRFSENQVVIAAAVSAVSLASRRKKLDGIILGLTLSSIGLIGGYAAGIIVSVLLITNIKKEQLKSSLWIAPFLLILAAWCLGCVLVRPDWSSLLDWWRNGFLLTDSSAILRVLQVLLKSAGWNSYERLWIWGLFAAAFAIFRKDNEIREGAYFGILIGLVFSSGLIWAQYFSPTIQSLSPNQTSFWNFLHRYSGALTDPNAAGFFALLALVSLTWVPLPFRSNQLSMLTRYVRPAFATCAITIGFLSGSRSFYLGIVCFLILLTLIRRPRAALFLCLGCAAVFTLINLIDRFGLLADGGLILASLPSGVGRLIDTLTISRWDDAFFSRFVFLKIALAIWRDNWLFGVGPTEFRVWMPFYVDKLQIPIGDWVDNSNNFYLGVLAELGVIGMAALLISFLRFPWKVKNPAVSAAVWTFLLLLITGPHLDFLEISLLFALILSDASVSPKFGAPDESIFDLNGSFAKGLFVLVFAMVVYHATQTPYGWYAPELSGKNPSRWTSRVAVATVPCECGVVNLQLQAAAASADRRITVLIDSPERTILTIDDLRPRQLSLRCAGENLRYTITTDPISIPGKLSRSRDYRILGVQVNQRWLGNGETCATDSSQK